MKFHVFSLLEAHSHIYFFFAFLSCMWKKRGKREKEKNRFRLDFVVAQSLFPFHILFWRYSNQATHRHDDVKRTTFAILLVPVYVCMCAFCVCWLGHTNFLALLSPFLIHKFFFPLYSHCVYEPRKNPTSRSFSG